MLFASNPKDFTDISGHWAKPYIDFVTQRELFVGTDSNIFSPNQGMTRAMQETTESIKQYGVLVPAIVRPREEGGYEIVAGHRRKHACELAGLETMPKNKTKERNANEKTVCLHHRPVGQ